MLCTRRFEDARARASTRAAYANAIVHDSTMPGTVLVQRFDPDQSGHLAGKSVLRRIGDKFGDDEAQAVTNVRR